jgi:4-hydroxythreonine-4-phosphate dehydrogenase
MTDQHPDNPLIISAGEPAGIGPDLCLGLLMRRWDRPLIIVADPEQMRQRAAMLSLDVDIAIYEPGKLIARDSLCVLPIDLANKNVCGTPDPANSPVLLEGLKRAVAGCQHDEFAALVTGPMQKSAINDSGIPFSGHTEFLAGLTNSETPVMLLVAGDLRVALVTTHLPLRDVADQVTAERIGTVTQVLHAGLVSLFGIEDPVINVCGLNPHAGEGGHLGNEDQTIIKPALDALREQGMRLRGPLPADTAFTPMSGSADAVLAMYHDQGLPVLKYAGFGNAVNITLGLPIIRTSVDHGTALDIAGSGKADHGSMYAAIDLAHALATK